MRRHTRVQRDAADAGSAIGRHRFSPDGGTWRVRKGEAVGEASGYAAGRDGGGPPSGSLAPAGDGSSALPVYEPKATGWDAGRAPDGRSCAAAAALYGLMSATES